MSLCTTCGRQHAEGVTSCEIDGTPIPVDRSSAGEQEDPLLGRTLDDKYRLDERLDGGGMGTVYRGMHLLIDRPVAIKVLNQRYAEDKTAQERFRLEARAAGRVRHINAIAVTDFGRTSDGLLYAVMELLEGRSLQDVLARESPLDNARSVALMLQISAAVASAHEVGIIHRDLKPGNVFLLQRSHAPTIVKVLDFGIAKLPTETNVSEENDVLAFSGGMSGTPRYMSPEQWDGVELTAASDVYSLGIILYEMLTGTTPFSSEPNSSLGLRQSSESLRSPREFVASIPPELEQLVLLALDKEPARRPSDAGTFRRELYAVAQLLGLEHAESFDALTLDSLRNAGTESPSGRLVVDIERLRENRSLRVKSGDNIQLKLEDEQGSVSPPDSSQGSEK